MRQSYADVAATTFWSVPSPDRGGSVELGALRFERDEIVDCRIEEMVEPDGAGRLATMALFFAAGLVLLLGLVDFSWRFRILIGGLVLAVIALVSTMEALGISRTVHYRIDIHLRDGRSIGYTTASREDAEALAAELGHLKV